ncbi:unnamed protein product [Didymodactylos carnosus]|uniref:Uncharacterized protein n=2 Tax=Didymodactylos carnosus TaxID=1234261 RepID=A0A814VBL9_9BILA|nr:unnamed protein product [Didymodactylos carnosus]CAF3949020.1 unnamed protein product [Didymodactylos carnosus]
MVSLTNGKPVLKQSESSNQLCDIIAVYCVKSELNKIRDIMLNINQTAMAIENYIFDHTMTRGTLSRLVFNEERYLIEYNQSPKAKWHANFLQLPNIDKEFLIYIINDIHNAMLIFYNSIGSLLETDEMFGFQIDEWFKQIHKNLRSNVICKIRNILYTYDAEWSQNTNDQITFRNEFYPSPSQRHNIKSVVLSRLLREWSNKLTSVINIIDQKLI